MRNELNHIEAIENYLGANMSASEKQAFEQSMRNDSSLKEEVDLQKALTDRIQFLAFKADVLAAHAQLAGAQKAWWKKGWFLNSIIALIACSAILLWFYRSPEETVSTPIVLPDVAEKTNIDSSVDNTVNLVTVDAPEDFSEPASTLKSSSHRTPKSQPHQAFVKSFETAALNANAGGTVITKDSKSAIRFAPNTLVDQEGNLVNGQVEIRYREFRNQAEMAFSGIPMMYEESGNQYRFNSAGMMEVRAYQNNEPVYVKPGASFTIDYNATQAVDSCFFFALNDETQQWEKKQPIDFSSGNRSQGTTANNEVNEVDMKRMPLKYRGTLRGRVELYNLMSLQRSANVGNVSVNLYYPKDYGSGKQPAYRAYVQSDSLFEIPQIDSGRYVARIGCDGCDNIVIDTVVIYADKVSQLNAGIVMNNDGNRYLRRQEKRAFSLFGKKRRNENPPLTSTYELKDSVMTIGKWQQLKRNPGLDTSAAPVTFAAGTGDLGKVSKAKSLLVQGLRAENFGIYNCDGIALVKDQVDVEPIFKTLKGVVITGIYMLSLIDLNINAAFSFSPQQFTFQRNGKNVVLAFTPTKLYAISAAEFGAMNIQQDGTYALKMTDLTDQIATVSDLKAFLEI